MLTNLQGQRRSGNQGHVQRRAGAPDLCRRGHRARAVHVRAMRADTAGRHAVRGLSRPTLEQVLCVRASVGGHVLLRLDISLSAAHVSSQLCGGCRISNRRRRTWLATPHALHRHHRPKPLLNCCTGTGRCRWCVRLAASQTRCSTWIPPRRRRRASTPTALLLQAPTRRQRTLRSSGRSGAGIPAHQHVACVMLAVLNFSEGDNCVLCISEHPSHIAVVIVFE